MTMTGDPVTCFVCGQLEADLRNVQQCFNCGNDFHLNPRNDVPGVDCGDAWIGESLGLEYFCQVCIDEMQHQSMRGAPDATTARHAEMMQAIAPSFPGAPPAPMLASAEAPARRGEPPPKRQRPPVRRRYRRIDS